MVGHEPKFRCIGSISLEFSGWEQKVVSQGVLKLEGDLDEGIRWI